MSQVVTLREVRYWGEGPMGIYHHGGRPSDEGAIRMMRVFVKWGNALEYNLGDGLSVSFVRYGVRTGLVTVCENGKPAAVLALLSESAQSNNLLLDVVGTFIDLHYKHPSGVGRGHLDDNSLLSANKPVIVSALPAPVSLDVTRWVGWLADAMVQELFSEGGDDSLWKRSLSFPMGRGDRNDHTLTWAKGKVAEGAEFFARSGDLKTEVISPEDWCRHYLEALFDPQSYEGWVFGYQEGGVPKKAQVKRPGARRPKGDGGRAG